jgi:hypothetical protein
VNLFLLPLSAEINLGPGEDVCSAISQHLQFAGKDRQHLQFAGKDRQCQKRKYGRKHGG